VPERTLRVADGNGGAGFIQIPREQLGELTPNGLALHAALLSYGWHGECWPGMEALQARTKMGERALRAAKTELVEAGLLDEKRRGQGKPNLYTVRTWDQRRIQNLQNGGSGTCVLQDEVEEGQVEEEGSLRSPSSSEMDGLRNIAESQQPSDLARKQTESKSGRQDVDTLCMRLAALMLHNDPKARIPKTAAAWKRWQDAARLLIDAEERHFEEALAVLEFTQRDDFEKSNILSMPKFRERYPQLRLKWLREQRPSNGAAAAPPVTTADLMAAYERRDDPAESRRRRAGVR
jgi:hypothetical protein